MTRFHIEPMEDPVAFLIRKGVRMHLLARSAEGRRSGMDRKLASERTAKARQRVMEERQ